MKGSALPHAQDFLRGEQGQNLSEYCLVTALIAVVALVIIVAVSGGLHNVWQLASATTSAATSSGGGVVAGH